MGGLLQFYVLFLEGGVASERRKNLASKYLQSFVVDGGDSLGARLLNGALYGLFSESPKEAVSPYVLRCFFTKRECNLSGIGWK